MDSKAITDCIQKMERCTRMQWIGSIKRLSRFGNEAVPHLVASLSSNSRTVALGSARALLQIGDEQGIASVIKSGVLDDYLDRCFLPAAGGIKNGTERGRGSRGAGAGREQAAEGIIPGDDNPFIDLELQEDSWPSTATVGPSPETEKKQDTGAAAPSRVNSDLQPLVGQRYWALLDDMMRYLELGMRTGRGACMAIVGAPGSGKTMMLQYLLERAGKLLCLACIDVACTEARAKDSGGGAPNLFYLDHAEHNGFLLERFSEKARRPGSFTVLTLRETVSLPPSISAASPEIFTMPGVSEEDIGEFLRARRMGGFRLGESTVTSVLGSISRTGKKVQFRQVERILLDLLSENLLREGPYQPGIPSITVDRSAESVEAAVGTFLGRTRSDIVSGEEVTNRLSGRVLGQERAIGMILPSLSMAISGLSDPRGTAGVYLFYGPTGCGKSELARAIADGFYGGALHKEDMNTYYAEHTVSSIIGSPPGYKDSGVVSPFLQFIRERDRGVILLDEIEKAHPTIFDRLMELLDTGFMRDAMGRMFDARGFLLIMTSNAAGPGTGRGPIGFVRAGLADDREDLARTGAFRPEFLGRVHVIAKFDKLKSDCLTAIAGTMYGELLGRFEAKGLAVEEDQGAPREIAEQFDERTGARSMRVYVETVLKERIMRRFCEEQKRSG